MDDLCAGESWRWATMEQPVPVLSLGRRASVPHEGTPLRRAPHAVRAGTLCLPR